MRRRLLCVPMMTLVLLTACGGTAAGDPAEELALAVRGEYLAMERCAAEVEITADYGQRVYEFLLSAAGTLSTSRPSCSIRSSMAFSSDRTQALPLTVTSPSVMVRASPMVRGRLFS